MENLTTTSPLKISIFWFRRDLRLEDNTGLFNALESGLPVLPIFIFDEDILDELPANDARVNFIYDELEKINQELRSFQSGLRIYQGKPEAIWEEITQEYHLDTVYYNKDYEPYALKRDLAITDFLAAKGIQSKSFKDQVIFEEGEVLKDDGEPYKVFTPYSKKWKKLFDQEPPTIHAEIRTEHFLPYKHDFPSKKKLGIEKSKIVVLPIDHKDLHNYGDRRNFPKFRTTDIGPHLRFGTVSIRQIFERVDSNNESYRNELIWREFFMQILFHFPKSANENFKSKYNFIQWRNNKEEYEMWCQGKTGYPMVDAGMRELNETGYMHGRVRMVVASFLCKHLLIDWRWGEAYFAQKLLDFELSSNVGNWQWSAGTGCDAAPYFRVFNPIEQLKKYDNGLAYTKKWVPELNELNYEPMVDHKYARERCLKVYKEGLAAN